MHLILFKRNLRMSAMLPMFAIRSSFRRASPPDCIPFRSCGNLRARFSRPQIPVRQRTAVFPARTHIFLEKDGKWVYYIGWNRALSS